MPVPHATGEPRNATLDARPMGCTRRGVGKVYIRTKGPPGSAGPSCRAGSLLPRFLTITKRTEGTLHTYLFTPKSESV